MADVSEKLWTNWNISVMAIGVSYCFIFLIIMLYNYCMANKKNAINRVIIYTTILHITSWLIHFICSLTTFIKFDNNLHDTHDNANYIICAMIILHPVLFYILMTFRLHYTFQTSVYSLKSLEFIIISICVLVIIISRFIEQTSWILVIQGNTPIIKVEQLMNYLWIFIAFDIATRLILVYLFVRKLFLILMKQTDARQTATTKRNSIVLNVSQIQFISLIKKITLLGVFSALPLTVARVIFVIDFLAVKGFFTHKHWIAFDTLQCVAVFLELLSIILVFRFNEKIYYIFCKYCDMGCSRCCTAEAKREIRLFSQTPPTNTASTLSSLPTVSSTSIQINSPKSSTIQETAIDNNIQCTLIQ